MQKRHLILGEYDTAADGLWTLASCKLSKPAQVQTFVEVPGRYAPLDLSTYLTDGQPYYTSRTLEARLESSEGDRLEREQRISDLVNYLDGKQVEILLPDYDGTYLKGRVQVAPEFNDLAHCAVNLSAVCEPWRYAMEETVVTLTAATEAQTVNMVNSGRLTVVPDLVLTGDTSLAYGDYSWTLSAGKYTLPELCLTPGEGFNAPGVHPLTYSGTGTITITYREAVL